MSKLKYHIPKGVNDILPETAEIYRTVENTAIDVFKSNGYEEIRIPTFEFQELFLRSIGTETEIVQKQMYTFADKKGRMMALKPEGTAGVIRAVLENSLLKKKSILKLFYIERMFRYEQPQHGRSREFNQIGAELIGLSSPVSDVQIIMLNIEIFSKLNIKTTLYINSLGCRNCQEKYKSMLLEHKSISEILCDDCKRRFDINPLRVLDCKIDKDKTADLPKIGKILCLECKRHFERLIGYLSGTGIKYEIDEMLVRGLDYYTRNVFEIKSDDHLQMDSISGGGRYDELISDFGGERIPAVGFAIGVDRVVEILKDNFRSQKEKDKIFVAVVDESKLIPALNFSTELRNNGFIVEGIYEEKSLKSQMRIADNISADYVVIIGDEFSDGFITLKNMKNSEQKLINKNDVIKFLKDTRK